MAEVELSPLGAEHNRREFDCGSAAENLFLRCNARQQQEQNLSATTVAVEARRVVGFVTVCPASMHGGAMRGRRTHFEAPVLLLAQMGVHRESQRSGLGRRLVLHALDRAVTMRNMVGCIGVLLDPVIGMTWYYQRFGFEQVPLGPRYPSCESPMFMPIEVAEQLLVKP